MVVLLIALLQSLAMLSTPVQENGPVRVSGEIDLTGVPPFEGATLRVSVVDAVADAPARTTASMSIGPVNSRRGEGDGRLRFAMEFAAPKAKGDYILEVHIDLDGDGEVSAGDVITTQYYPVLRGERRSKVIVKVEKI